MSVDDAENGKSINSNVRNTRKNNCCKNQKRLLQGWEGVEGIGSVLDINLAYSTNLPL